MSQAKYITESLGYFEAEVARLLRQGRNDIENILAESFHVINQSKVDIVAEEQIMAAM